jgi:hypothetical protein
MWARSNALIFDILQSWNAGPGGQPASFSARLWGQNRPVQSNPVALSRTRSNQSNPEDATEAKEGHKVKPSRRDLEPWQIALVTFATFCSNPYGPPGCCAVFTHFRPNRRRLIKPVALSQTSSQQLDLPEMEVQSARNAAAGCDELQYSGPNRRLSHSLAVYFFRQATRAGEAGCAF